MPETYNLSDARRPALDPGEYELRVSWNVAFDKTPAGPENTETATFQVTSERFRLNPAEIGSVYPPEGTTGNYEYDLPQVVLTRDTLPWERTAKKGCKAPWLALLLFTDDEIAHCKVSTITVKEYRDHVAASSPNVTVVRETGEDKEYVTIIELARDLPHNVFPRLKELALLCHARTVHKDEKFLDATSVVVSKRLPSVGRNTAHLVALEDRFTGEDFPLPVGTEECKLVSIKSWTFTHSDAHVSAPDESMNTPFAKLSAAWLRLNPQGASNYEEAGHVPLQHWFRSGERAPSWYAGPLSCGISMFAKSDAALVKLPVDCADDLLWFDEDLGMLNATYAAAWELGRMLAQQDRKIFSLLHKWRRQKIHCHQALEGGKHEAACCHLPQIQCSCAEPAPQAPPELKGWMKGLRRLEGIPHRYLLPDERLLPPESVRFVVLDQNYIAAMLDGVMSSVRAPSLWPDECRKGELELVAGDHPQEVTGFLVRSAAVAALPGLEAVATGRNASEVLESYHSARISPSIRLFLFEGKARTVILRRRADSVHLSVRLDSLGKRLTWTNQDKRAVAIPETTSSALAKRWMDQPEELMFQIAW